MNRCGLFLSFGSDSKSRKFANPARLSEIKGGKKENIANAFLFCHRMKDRSDQLIKYSANINHEFHKEMAL